MTLTAQLTLDDGGHTVSLAVSAKALAVLAAALPDHDNMAMAFDLLSRHTDGAVRAAVAAKQRLPASAIRRLADDSAQAILKILLKSSEACCRLSTDEVLGLCRRDPALADMVAARYESFMLGDDAVLAFLEGHADSRVRESLAGNPFVSKHVLHRLAENDADEQVRELARQTGEI